MDQRFSLFFLEKYRLELQQGARPSYEDEAGNEKVFRPSKLRQLIRHMVAWIIASSKVLKEKDNSVMDHTRINNQSYSE